MTNSPQQIAIFGSGSFAGQLGAAFEAVGSQVVAYLDWEPRSSTSVGTSVSYRFFDHIHLPVLIGINNPYVDVTKVLETLKQVGYSDVRTPVSSVNLLHECGGELESFWLSTSLKSMTPSQVSMQDIVNRFGDQETTVAWEAMHNYRLVGTEDTYGSPLPLEEQYFPPDLLETIDYSAFLDIGAFDGDTIRSIKSNEIPVIQYLGFEPDPKNFSLAETSLLESKLFGSVVPYGCSSFDGVVRFSSDGSSSSTISDIGEDEIKVVSLDRFLVDQEFKPTFIKMDIEGGELNALKGLVDTISKFSPAMAVSLYHRPEDPWVIPRFIMSCGSSYKFFIRTYGWNTFETVLYAIPNRQLEIRA